MLMDECTLNTTFLAAVERFMVFFFVVGLLSVKNAAYNSCSFFGFSSKK